MLFPVEHPGRNLLECVKQLVLLEHHLVDKSARCPDCITKHFLATAGYLEELPSLDSEQEFRELVESALPVCYNLFQAWGDGYHPRHIAHHLRGMRKGIQPHIMRLAKREGIPYSIPPEPEIPYHSAIPCQPGAGAGGGYPIEPTMCMSSEGCSCAQPTYCGRTCSG